jgi:hypothetical protein
MEWNWTTIFEAVIMPMLALVIPLAGVKLRQYVNTANDKARVEKLDIIAESILDLVLLNNPKLSILNDVDRVKDLVVAELLKDATVPLTNAKIAARVAATAIRKAQ